MRIGALIFLLVSLTTGLLAQSESGISFSTEAEVKEQIGLAPCKNADRLDAVKKLFVKAGATADEMKIEKFKDVENLTVTKKGASSETVVVGAHYDKSDDGCGAIDNWTGIVILANLYRTMRPLTTQKTYVFAAFGREEEGMIGSTAMASAIKKEDRANYCAMVNFDSYGFTYPQVLTNISSESLTKLAESVSKDLNIPFAKAGIYLASSDSAPFMERKIPAITLHGMSRQWQEYLHSSRDKVSNVNSHSVYVGYRHGVTFLAHIESSPCEAFRK